MKRIIPLLAMALLSAAPVFATIKIGDYTLSWEKKGSQNRLVSQKKDAKNKTDISPWFDAALRIDGGEENFVPTSTDTYFHPDKLYFWARSAETGKIDLWYTLGRSVRKTYDSQRLSGFDQVMLLFDATHSSKVEAVFYAVCKSGKWGLVSVGYDSGGSSRTDVLIEPEYDAPPKPALFLEMPVCDGSERFVKDAFLHVDNWEGLGWQMTKGGKVGYVYSCESAGSRIRWEIPAQYDAECPMRFRQVSKDKDKPLTFSTRSCKSKERNVPLSTVVPFVRHPRTAILQRDGKLCLYGRDGEFFADTLADRHYTDPRPEQGREIIFTSDGSVGGSYMIYMKNGKTGSVQLDDVHARIPPVYEVTRDLRFYYENKQLMFRPERKKRFPTDKAGVNLFWTYYERYRRPDLAFDDDGRNLLADQQLQWVDRGFHADFHTEFVKDGRTVTGYFDRALRQVVLVDDRSAAAAKGDSIGSCGSNVFIRHLGGYGLKNRTADRALPCVFDTIRAFDAHGIHAPVYGEFAVFEKNGKMGLAAGGRVLFRPIFDQLEIVGDTLTACVVEWPNDRQHTFYTGKRKAYRRQSMPYVLNLYPVGEGEWMTEDNAEFIADQCADSDDLGLLADVLDLASFVGKNSLRDDAMTNYGLMLEEKALNASTLNDAKSLAKQALWYVGSSSGGTAHEKRINAFIASTSERINIEEQRRLAEQARRQEEARQARAQAWVQLADALAGMARGVQQSVNRYAAYKQRSASVSGAAAQPRPALSSSGDGSAPADVRSDSDARKEKYSRRARGIQLKYRLGPVYRSWESKIIVMQVRPGEFSAARLKTAQDAMREIRASVIRYGVDWPASDLETWHP